MTDQSEPVMLDLAQLPREKIGPFLLLGLEKDADKEQIEANWAKRLIWARKNLTKVSLEDINWAKEFVNDPERRARADVMSLNTDVLDGVVRSAVKRYGGQADARPTWKPLDVETPLHNYAPAVELPDWKAVRDGIVPPEVPEEFPAVEGLVAKLMHDSIDPWSIILPDHEQPPAPQQENAP